MSNALPTVLTSQYQAALAMLRNALIASPASLWDDPAHGNRTWRIVYHTLHCTRNYLGPSDEAFPRWEHALKDAEYLGPRWEPPYDVPVVEGHNTPEQLTAYLDAIAETIPGAVAGLPLDGESGFPWLLFSRLELHLYNIRHIQHHAGQLTERLRAHGAEGGLEWVMQGKDESIGQQALVEEWQRASQ